MKRYLSVNSNAAELSKNEMQHVLGGFFDDSIAIKVQEDFELDSACNESCRRGCKDGCKQSNK